MGYSSRRPHRVPLLSEKNRTRRIQFTQVHQNWTIEDWKTLPGLMRLDFCCDIQMVGSEFGVKNMKAWIILLFSTVQAGGGGCNGVGDIFLAHFGPLLPIEHRLNFTAYLSMVADHVHPFMTTVYPSSDDYFQQDYAPYQKFQVISDWFLEHDNEFCYVKRRIFLCNGFMVLCFFFGSVWPFLNTK